jgi:hypothetical protein
LLNCTVAKLEFVIGYASGAQVALSATKYKNKFEKYKAKVYVFCIKKLPCTPNSNRQSMVKLPKLPPACFYALGILPRLPQKYFWSLGVLPQVKLRYF